MSGRVDWITVIAVSSIIGLLIAVNLNLLVIIDLLRAAPR